MTIFLYILLGTNIVLNLFFALILALVGYGVIKQRKSVKNLGGNKKC